MNEHMAKRWKVEPIRFGHAFAIMTEDFDEDANTGMSFKPGSQGGPCE